MRKMIDPASNTRDHRLTSPCAVDVGETLHSGADEMPRPRVEGGVEIRDEMLLCEVELDAVEQFREQ